MGIKDIKQNRFFKFFTNRFVIILIIFLVWILIFDENTHLNREFNKEIKELKTTIDFYKKEIEKDKQTIKQLQDSLQLERFAREKYLMKKDNEDVYIIEFDSVKN
jgi:cell division protein FtsB